jgi:hypothetical protein
VTGAEVSDQIYRLVYRFFFHMAHDVCSQVEMKRASVHSSHESRVGKLEFFMLEADESRHSD